jgi:hypothetical protein
MTTEYAILVSVMTVYSALWAAFAARQQVSLYGCDWRVLLVVVLHFFLCPLGILVAIMSHGKYKVTRIDEEKKRVVEP